MRIWLFWGSLGCGDTSQELGVPPEPERPEIVFASHPVGVRLEFHSPPDSFFFLEEEGTDIGLEPILIPTPIPVKISPAELLHQQAQTVQVRSVQQEQRVSRINEDLLEIVNKLRKEKGLPLLPEDELRSPPPLQDGPFASPL